MNNSQLKLILKCTYLKVMKTSFKIIFSNTISLFVFYTLLLNQTWVSLPAMKQSPSIDAVFGEGKNSVYFRHQARSLGTSCSKDLNSLMAFRKEF